MMRGRRLLTSAATIVAGVLIAATLWAFAREPILRAVYSDVPPLTFPADLDKPFEFRARIIDTRQYWVDLLVHYENKDQRDAVEQVVGGYPGSKPSPTDAGVPAQFRVVVRDEGGRVVRDDNLNTTGMKSIGVDYRRRRIDEFILGPGVYSIQVTPVGDLSRFREFRTSLQFTTQPKATPIRY